MLLRLLYLIPAVTLQMFNLGISAGDNNQGYQPLLPQMNNYPGYGTLPYSVSPYNGYFSGIQPYQPTVYYAVPVYGSGAGDELPRPEAPMKRFMKGAAEGFVMSGLGMFGR